MDPPDPSHSPRTRTPKVSVIIPNFNGKKWLRDCVRALLQSKYPLSAWELIIVDNGSTDGAVDEVETELLRNSGLVYRVLKNNHNTGWSPANNQGFRVSTGQILVSLSNDVQTDACWLRELVNAFESDREVGIAQCLCLSLRDRITLDSGLSFFDRFGFSYGYKPVPGGDPVDVSYAEGAAFAMSRTAYEKTGGLDDDYFMQYDDVDLSWRARLSGFKVKLVPRSIVYHARGGTVGATIFKTWPRVLFLVTRNHLTTLYKNLQWRNAVIVIPIVTTVHLVKSAILVGMGQTRRGVAIGAGVLVFYTTIPRLQKKRREIQKSRVIADSAIFDGAHSFRPDLLRNYFSSGRLGVRSFFSQDALRKNVGR
jgi:GT2 family glycosyltransferase